MRAQPLKDRWFVMALNFLFLGIPRLYVYYGSKRRTHSTPQQGRCCLSITRAKPLLGERSVPIEWNHSTPLFIIGGTFPVCFNIIYCSSKKTAYRRTGLGLARRVLLSLMPDECFRHIQTRLRQDEGLSKEKSLSIYFCQQTIPSPD